MQQVRWLYKPTFASLRWTLGAGSLGKGAAAAQTSGEKHNIASIQLSSARYKH